jgi:hypothetical protein
VAERAADAFSRPLELGGHGDAVVAPTTEREVLVCPDARDAAWERLAIDALDRPVEGAATNAGARVVEDRDGNLVHKRSTRRQFRLRTCARSRSRG